VSSSYGRPGIRRVNVSAGGQRSNTPSVQLPSGSRVTPNAPYRGLVNPGQAAKNVEIRNQSINKLIEFATGEQVQKFAIDQFENAAKREAGAAIDAYPGIDTTSGGNQEAIDAFNALSPRAKDNVIQARTVNAVERYGPALAAEYEARPIIRAAGSSPQQLEQRAQAVAEAQASAREVAGLSGLPAYQVAQVSKQLASIDGKVQGNAYRLRLAKESDLAQVGLIQGAASVISKGWRDLSEQGASDVAGDQPLTTGLRSVFETVAKTSAENFGPQGQANILAAGIGESLGRLTDPQEKLEFIERAAEIAKVPLRGADTRTDLFSIPIGNTGKSIKDILAEYQPEFERDADKALIGKAFLEAMQLPPEQARATMLSYAEALNDPSLIPQFISQIDSLTTRVTPEMRQNGNIMFDRALDGEDRTALYKEMIAAPIGTYSPQDIQRMFGLANQGGDDVEFREKQREFLDYKRTTSDSYDVAFSEFLEYTDIRPDEYSRIDGEGKTVETIKYKNAKAAFYDEVRQRFFDKRDAAEPGKFDPQVAIKEAYKETAAAQKERAVDVKPVTPTSLFNDYTKPAFKALQSAAAASGGKLAPENIPAQAIRPQTLQKWQAANPGKTFNSLTGKAKERLMIQSFMGLKRYDKPAGEYRYFTEDEAKKQVDTLLKDAEKASANAPAAPVQQRVPQVVPETESELQEFRRNGGSRARVNRKSTNNTLELLERAAEWATTPQKDPFNFNKVFNSGGLGPQAMSYVNGFLNMVTGAAPATAGELTYGTPEALVALRRSWESGQRGLSTPPMPQVAASTPVRPVPTAIGNDQHELFVMVGVAEGTRTASGGYTKAYYGHTDSGDGNWNRGTVSGGRGTSLSPAMVDQQWMGRLTAVQQRMRPYLIVYGLQPGTQGYNRVMFNMIDLTVQSPAAARDFAGKLPQMKAGGWTIESIAKARSDSFINPRTGRLEASGFGNSYQRLMQDQRSRAGVYDYRRRI